TPPLIEPDGRFSRIRLSDQTSRLRPREALRLRTQPHQPQYLVQVLVGELGRSPRIDPVLATEPPTQPLPGVVIHGPVCGTHRTEAEVVRPAGQQPVESSYLVLGRQQHPPAAGHRSDLPLNAGDLLRRWSRAQIARPRPRAVTRADGVAQEVKRF